MNILSELQESFSKHLGKLLNLTLDKDEHEVDYILVKQATGEEEEKVIHEICNEIDLRHKLMDELQNSGMQPGEWLESEIENTTKELYPNATPEEIEMVKQKVEEGMEEEIGLEADSLKEEISSLQHSTEDNIIIEREKEV